MQVCVKSRARRDTEVSKCGGWKGWTCGVTHNVGLRSKGFAQVSDAFASFSNKWSPESARHFISSVVLVQLSFSVFFGNHWLNPSPAPYLHKWTVAFLFFKAETP